MIDNHISSFADTTYYYTRVNLSLKLVTHTLLLTTDFPLKSFSKIWISKLASAGRKRIVDHCSQRYGKLHKIVWREKGVLDTTLFNAWGKIPVGRDRDRQLHVQ